MYTYTDNGWGKGAITTVVYRNGEFAKSDVNTTPGGVSFVFYEWGHFVKKNGKLFEKTEKGLATDYYRGEGVYMVSSKKWLGIDDTYNYQISNGELKAYYGKNGVKIADRSKDKVDSYDKVKKSLVADEYQHLTTEEYENHKW